MVRHGVILEPSFSSDKKAVLEKTSTWESDVNEVGATTFATEHEAPQPREIKGKFCTICSYVINVLSLSSHILLI